MPSLDSLLNVKAVESEKPLLDDAKVKQLEAFRSKVQNAVKKTK